MDLSKSYEFFQPEKDTARIHIVGCGSGRYFIRNQPRNQHKNRNKHRGMEGQTDVWICVLVRRQHRNP